MTRDADSPSPTPSPASGAAPCSDSAASPAATPYAANAAPAQPSTQPTQRPPRLALLIATGFGLGYVPKAPGTWGSLGAIALCVGTTLVLQWLDPLGALAAGHPVNFYHLMLLEFVFLVLAAFTAAVGLWASDSIARFSASRDPQHVVIDEISGQMISIVSPNLLVLEGLPYDWQYLLVGFILFRVFDIWKPWPVRAAERLPGGWGIMADDWVAGIYAALCLWSLRAVGL